MATIAYTRISTDDKHQTVENQEHQMLAHSPTVFISDKGVSGSIHPTARAGFSRLLAVAKTGDKVLITAFDRLSRDTKHFLEVLTTLQQRGLALVSLREQVDTTTPSGLMVATTLMAVATLERDLIRERVCAGLERAKASGKRLGRPRSDQHQTVRTLLAGGVSVRDVCERTGMSRSGVYKIRNEISLD